MRAAISIAVALFSLWVWHMTGSLVCLFLSAANAALAVIEMPRRD